MHVGWHVGWRMACRMAHACMHVDGHGITWRDSAVVAMVCIYMPSYIYIYIYMPPGETRLSWPSYMHGHLHASPGGTRLSWRPRRPHAARSRSARACRPPIDELSTSIPIEAAAPTCRHMYACRRMYACRGTYVCKQSRLQQKRQRLPFCWAAHHDHAHRNEPLLVVDSCREQSHEP